MVPAIASAVASVTTDTAKGAVQSERKQASDKKKYDPK